MTEEISLMHHRNGVAGRARVRYDCMALSGAAKVGASDLVKHHSSKIIVRQALE